MFLFCKTGIFAGKFNLPIDLSHLLQLFYSVQILYFSCHKVREKKRSCVGGGASRCIHRSHHSHLNCKQIVRCLQVSTSRQQLSLLKRNALTALLCVLIFFVISFVSFSFVTLGFALLVGQKAI